MGELKDYRVTETAGPYVAGKRVPFVTVTERGPGGDEVRREVPDPEFRLQLTEAQARYELMNGTIEEVEPAQADIAPEVPPAEAASSTRRRSAAPAADVGDGQV